MRYSIELKTWDDLVFYLRNRDDIRVPEILHFRNKKGVIKIPIRHAGVDELKSGRDYLLEQLQALELNLQALESLLKFSQEEVDGEMVPPRPFIGKLDDCFTSLLNYFGLESTDDDLKGFSARRTTLADETSRAIDGFVSGMR